MQNRERSFIQNSVTNLYQEKEYYESGDFVKKVNKPFLDKPTGINSPDDVPIAVSFKKATFIIVFKKNEDDKYSADITKIESVLVETELTTMRIKIENDFRDAGLYISLTKSGPMFYINNPSDNEILFNAKLDDKIISKKVFIINHVRLIGSNATITNTLAETNQIYLRSGAQILQKNFFEQPVIVENNGSIAIAFRNISKGNFVVVFEKKSSAKGYYYSANAGDVAEELLQHLKKTLCFSTPTRAGKIISIVNNIEIAEFEKFISSHKPSRTTKIFPLKNIQVQPSEKITTTIETLNTSAMRSQSTTVPTMQPTKATLVSQASFNIYKETDLSVQPISVTYTVPQARTQPSSGIIIPKVSRPVLPTSTTTMPFVMGESHANAATREEPRPVQRITINANTPLMFSPNASISRVEKRSTTDTDATEKDEQTYKKMKPN